MTSPGNKELPETRGSLGISFINESEREGRRQRGNYSNPVGGSD